MSSNVTYPSCKKNMNRTIKTSTLGEVIILFSASVLSFAVAGMAQYSSCASNPSYAQSAGLPTCNSMIDVTFLALGLGIIFLFVAGAVFFTHRKVRNIITEENQKPTSAPPAQNNGIPQQYCSACGTKNAADGEYCANCGEPRYALAVQ
jgi:hypothetical protein